MSNANDDRGSLIEKAADRLRQGQAATRARPAPAAPPPGGASDPSWATGPQPPAHTPPQRGPERGPEATIDLAGLKAQGYVTPEAERSQVAEEFRIIKRPVLENAFGRSTSLVDHGNLVMVTSAIPGEGKTFTAVNLAMSIAAEMDKTVLLIDADVGRARVHDLLKVPMGPGLIDLLTDSSLDVGDVMLRTNVPKLRVIPMGGYHPHANELVASETMRQLTQELATRYPDRMVIFDAPPILATSEAVVLAGLVGQLVFVVEAERTLQSNVQDALGLLDTAKPIGLVLNKSRSYSGHGYYGYGNYGYHGAAK
ncbi:MAG: tyrosine-protein kinase family protein [Thioalkalivibrio sp.]|nr:MAG: tyrosine-protein kinase family protein [Thioalkalivibrio sp.]